MLKGIKLIITIILAVLLVAVIYFIMLFLYKKYTADKSVTTPAEEQSSLTQQEKKQLEELDSQRKNGTISQINIQDQVNQQIDEINRLRQESKKN